MNPSIFLRLQQCGLFEEKYTLPFPTFSVADQTLSLSCLQSDFCQFPFFYEINKEMYE